MAGGAVGVVAVGGAGVWAFATRAGTRTGARAAAGRRGKRPGAGVSGFTTPPPGTAPQVLWHRTAQTDTLNSDQPLLAHNGLLIISGDPLIARRATTAGRMDPQGRRPAGAPLIFADGRLFLVSTEYDGDVIGLDAGTGKEAWRAGSRAS